MSSTTKIEDSPGNNAETSGGEVLELREEESGRSATMMTMATATVRLEVVSLPYELKIGRIQREFLEDLTNQLLRVVFFFDRSK